MKRHFRRPLLAACLLAALAAPPLFAANDLPSLGTVAESALPQAEENRIGRDILRSLRGDGDVIDDAEVNAYLADLGGRLAAGAQLPGMRFAFFAVNDRSINAFALPGGVIGVHSGLLLATQSEGELASVLAHEIAHVSQRHLARMQEGEGNRHLLMLAAILAGMLASNASNGDVSAGMVNAGVGLAASRQLAYSRDFEREADRIGMQYLTAAGFDARSMAGFFDRLQQTHRHNDNNAFGFLRTHPLTGERVSEAQNRAQGYPLRMRADSQDFLLMREKLRLATLGAAEAERHYRTALAAGRFLQPGATYYGLARALLQLGRHDEAQQALASAQRQLPPHPALLLLGGDIQRAAANLDGALARYQQALQQFPSNDALWLARIDTLLQARRSAEARQQIELALKRAPDNAALWRLAARSYGEADALRYHAALGHAFYIEQEFESARIQYQLASRAGGDDFYLRSTVEARLREIDKQRPAKPR